RARDGADPKMIMRLSIGIEARFQTAQRFDAAQLRIGERHQMIPTRERLVVGIRVVALHRRLEGAPIERFEQTAKDAIEKSHARSFLSLDNQKEPVCIGSAEHAPRHTESFPGQPCAKAGTTENACALRERPHCPGAGGACIVAGATQPPLNGERRCCRCEPACWVLPPRSSAPRSPRTRTIPSTRANVSPR